MSEYIVDDKLVQGIINEAYRKGKGGVEVWTQREWRQEPIVRCKDCIHCADDYIDTGEGLMPAFTCEDVFCGGSVEPDGFCAWGERDA